MNSEKRDDLKKHEKKEICGISTADMAGLSGRSFTSKKLMSQGYITRFIAIFLLAFMSVNAQLLRVDVEEHVLPNGLKVLLYQDKHFPSVACRMFCKMGSVNEYPGITGISHMFEHMMFKGTKRIGVTDWNKDSLLLVKIDKAYGLYDSLRRHSGDSAKISRSYHKFKLLSDEEKPLIIKDELWKLYSQNGGTHLNAFTTDILTAYFVTLPKNKVELYFWLESDRIQNAVLREFYSERNVVAEERRMRYENRPDGRYWESLNTIFYEAHPYRNPTIGWMSDIEYFNKTILKKRFNIYYKPNNLILVFAGDFDPENILRLANKYFGKIPRGKVVPPKVTVKEPVQVGEKRFIVRKQANPRMDLLFHTPGLGKPDLYALDIIEGVLSGRNGRLYKRLVKDMELCTNADAGNGVQKYTSYFHINVALKEKTDPEKVEKILFEELERLKKEPLSDYELERVKNNVAARTVNGLRRTEDVANRLGFWEVMGGWKYINVFPKGVQNAGKEDVMRVAAKYFTRDNLTAGVLVSEGENKPDVP